MSLCDVTHSIFEDAVGGASIVALHTSLHWATPRALHGKDDSKSRTPYINNIRLEALQRMKRSPPSWTVIMVLQVKEKVMLIVYLWMAIAMFSHPT
jgi:hypothetical protein